jgi:hypothetical protein
MSGFYDEGELRRIAIKLFYGWGYNFYRVENQLRADDQMVRSQASRLLGMARSSVERAETDYRHEFIRTPTREKPFPDPDIVTGARDLERLGAEIGLVGNRLQALPVPENDRMTQRYRKEADTLQALIHTDEQLTGQASLLQTLLDGKNGLWMLEHQANIKEGLLAIQQTLRGREEALIGRVA